MINIYNEVTMWNRMMYPFDVLICAHLSQIVTWLSGDEKA